MPASKSTTRKTAVVQPRPGLVRPLVRRLKAYVPGEQPRIAGLIKLNTNENPYPPAPAVLAAIRKAVDGRLRLYPDPTAQALREKLAQFHRCSPDQILVGNGCDELLALATRVFVEPAPQDAEPAAARSAASTIQFFTPSYSLYPVLADIHGATSNPIPLPGDFSLPPVAELRRGGTWDFQAALTLVTTPNAPSGRGYATTELDQLCRAQRGVVILDETYVDFAEENALALALKQPHVLVARTFSKAYSLCFQRVGYFVGHAGLIAAVDKVRDSYNVNGLGQIAAAATLDHLPYYRRNFQRILRTRRLVATRLGQLGFEVGPSQANFLLVRPPRFPAETWLARLREQRILVRWFPHSTVRDYLRISIGSESEMRTFLGVCELLLSSTRKLA
jgi:histidinol-phosphate aminotransferase